MLAVGNFIDVGIVDIRAGILRKFTQGGCDRDHRCFSMALLSFIRSGFLRIYSVVFYTQKSATLPPIYLDAPT